MAKKIIYFTAGIVPTVTEVAEIANLKALTAAGYTLSVRDGAKSASYAGGIESCDIVAGTIPTAFNAKTTYGFIDALRPVCFGLSPATKTIAALATVQLTPIAVMGTDLTNLVPSALAANVTYVSSVPGKATVDANGLVTGVATGTTTITATYTFTSGKTITATCLVTVTST